MSVGVGYTGEKNKNILGQVQLKSIYISRSKKNTFL